MFRATVLGRRVLTRSAHVSSGGSRAAPARHTALPAPAGGMRALATVGVGGGQRPLPEDNGGGTMKVVSVIFGCLGAYMVRTTKKDAEVFRPTSTAGCYQRWRLRCPFLPKLQCTHIIITSYLPSPAHTAAARKGVLSKDFHAQ